MKTNWFPLERERERDLSLGNLKCRHFYLEMTVNIFICETNKFLTCSYLYLQHITVTETQIFNDISGINYRTTCGGVFSKFPTSVTNFASFS